MTEKEILQAAIDTYGKKSQCAMAMEECGELVQAINKVCREFSYSRRDNLIEEIADVLIMIEQLKLMFDLSDREISIMRDRKLQRLERRIRERRTNDEESGT